LTKNGIGVLRYDDRGVGKSTGDFSSSTSANFATDVESDITYLKTRKEVNKTGLIDPIVTSKSEDVSFMVLLAGSGIKGNKLLLLQQRLISRANGVSEESIKKSNQVSSKLYQMVIELKILLKILTIIFFNFISYHFTFLS